mgnify:CR=1 FL=1
MSLENYESTTMKPEDFRVVYDEYENFLRRCGKIDFDDMLVFTYELLSERPDILKMWQNKFRYILIDEFQDINMIQYDIVGIAGVDTRRLARHIRDEGTCKALIVDAQTPSIACLAEMRSTALSTNQVSVVSTKSPWISACANPKHRVVAVDCGIKHNIIRLSLIHISEPTRRS